MYKEFEFAWAEWPDATPAADQKDEDSAYEVGQDYTRSDSSASSTSHDGRDDSDNDHHKMEAKEQPSWSSFNLSDEDEHLRSKLVETTIRKN